MGISMDFADNVAYGASDLNSLRCALATKGVLPEESTACMAVLGSQNKTVKICGGQALFSDGARCSIDAEGVSVSVTDTCYLYLSREEDGAQVKTSGSLPSGGNTVLLAKAEVSGNTVSLTDMREYTVLKIPSCTVNTYDEFILKKNFNDAAVKSYDSSKSLTSGVWCKVHEFSVNNQNYKHVCLFDNAETVENKRYLAWGNLNSGKYWCSYVSSLTSEEEVDFVYGGDEIVLYQTLTSTKRVRFVKSGAKIEIWYYSTVKNNLPFYFDAQIKFA
ncbi:MAG: hypothetical protein SO147_09885 [Clostridia bacterium]|nr:hypothetical protein [Clostridia bacterium]